MAVLGFGCHGSSRGGGRRGKEGGGWCFWDLAKAGKVVNRGLELVVTSSTTGAKWQQVVPRSRATILE